MLMKQTISFIRRAGIALLMMMLTTTTAWAEQVTEEQARQQAQDFLTSLRPTSKARRAPGTTPQLATTRQVRGDYGSDGKSEWVASLFTTPADNTTAISLPALGLTPGPSPKGEGSFKGEERICTLEGVKLDKMPTRKGVYIRNGRKVVIK